MGVRFGEIGECSGRIIQTGDVVEFLTLRRTCLLARFRKALAEHGGPGAADERWRVACVSWADAVITRSLGSLAVPSGGVPRTEITVPGYNPAPEEQDALGALRAHLEPADLVSISTLLFDCFGKHLHEYSDMHGHAGPAVLAVSTALHRVLMAQLGTVLLDRSRALLAGVKASQQVERLRLSRDMHDRLGSSVAAARQNLELFTRRRDTDPEQAERHLLRTGALLDEAVDALPAMITEVRTRAVPQDLGSALREFARTAADGQVRVAVHGDEALLTEFVREETFLILREALRNALRHSHCLLASVVVRCGPDALSCSVEDDGIGFDPEQSTAGSNRYGLESMRERARLLGGLLRVRTSIGHGTRVELHVPLGPGARP